MLYIIINAFFGERRKKRESETFKIRPMILALT